MNAELISKLRSAGADGDTIHCWNMCMKAADALEAAQAKEAAVDRLLVLFKDVQAVADERDAALARVESINDDRNYIQGQLREALARLAEVQRAVFDAAQSAQPLRELSEEKIEYLYTLFRGKEISHSRHVWLPFARAVLEAAKSKL